MSSHTLFLNNWVTIRSSSPVLLIAIALRCSHLECDKSHDTIVVVFDGLAGSSRNGSSILKSGPGSSLFGSGIADPVYGCRLIWSRLCIYRFLH